VLTGLLSRTAQPWLADHVVSGLTLVPGAALVELAIQGGDLVGLPVVEELVLEAPLVVPDSEALLIQVVVAAVDESGRRSVEVHARLKGEQSMWTRHAVGTLTSDTVEGLTLPDWPPAGARPVDLERFYEDLADGGYEYGPVFQGVTRAWHGDQEVFAEGRSPRAGPSRPGSPSIPLCWTRPCTCRPCCRTRATSCDFRSSGTRSPSTPVRRQSVRAQVRAVDGGVTVALTDMHGAPVLTLRSLITKPADLRATSRSSGALFGVDWKPFSANTTTDPLSWVVLRAEAGSRPVREVVAEVLRGVQEFLTDPGLESCRLVVTTEGAVSADGVTEVDPVAAAVWGLVRTAQAEHPDRIMLADGVDGLSALDAAVAAGEWQIAVRDGNVLVPRLVRVPEQPPTRAWGSGRHRVDHRRHRRSRRPGGPPPRGRARCPQRLCWPPVGAWTPTARPKLCAELRALGVRIEVVACDGR